MNVPIPTIRRRLRSARAALALAGLLAVGSGETAFAQAIIFAPAAPPPPRVEVVPVVRPGHVWDAGHWRWNGRRYVWMTGHWQRVVVGARWVPGGWGPHGRGYGWTAGHWAR